MFLRPTPTISKLELSDRNSEFEQSITCALSEVTLPELSFFASSLPNLGFHTTTE